AGIVAGVELGVGGVEVVEVEGDRGGEAAVAVDLVDLEMLDLERPSAITDLAIDDDPIENDALATRREALEVPAALRDLEEEHSEMFEEGFAAELQVHERAAIVDAIRRCVHRGDGIPIASVPAPLPAGHGARRGIGEA